MNPRIGHLAKPAGGGRVRGVLVGLHAGWCIVATNGIQKLRFKPVEALDMALCFRMVGLAQTRHQLRVAATSASRKY